jgi:hypothetical protein
MNQWNEWVACNFYIGIRSHFGNDNFNFIDMFRNNYCFYNTENYKKRNDKVLFRRLSQQYKKEDFVKYIISNIVYKSTSKDQATRMHLSEMNEDNLKSWKGKTESLFYNFKSDIVKLLDNTDSFENLFICTKDTIPPLLQINTSIETLTILNSFVGFSNKFDKEMNHYIWPHIGFKVKKYNILLSHFTNYDSKRYKNFLVEIIGEKK